MYTEREYDIMLLEAQEENDKLIQEVALELLGNRAKRMVKNGEIDRGNDIPEAGPNAPGGGPAAAPPPPPRSRPPPGPVVTPRGTFTPGVQPWVNPRAAESAAIGQAVAGAINTVAGAITTGPGGQVGRGSIGVGDWRNLAVNIPSAIPTRTVGPAGRAGLPAGAGFTTGMAAQGGAQRPPTAPHGGPPGAQA